MRIAVAASPEVAIPTLEAIMSSSHQLVRVISQPDKPAGRGRVMTPTPVSMWAVNAGIDLVKPDSVAQIAESVADCDSVITIGYGKLLPSEILAIPRYGFLNLHFSLLPRWRGAAPVQRSIEAQDSVSGVTVFLLDEGMDTGPIYTVHRFALDSDITSDELLKELGELGVNAVLETLEKIEAGVRPTPQESTGATRALKLSRSEGEIDWSQKAEVLSAKIRAFTSNPGAWTTFRGSVLKIASPKLSQIELSPGEIALIDKKVLIGTGSLALEIGMITAHGKQPIEASAWANGARLVTGEPCE
jgi:methionyl-tRNA formyltransferase